MPRIRVLLLILTLLVTTASLVGAISISGYVRAAGTDAADASVSVFSLNSSWDRSDHWAHGKAHPEALAQVQTKKDGTFEIEAPSELARWVRVELKGYLPVEFVLRPLLGPMVLPIVDLEPAREVELEFSLGGTEPVASAKVLVTRVSEALPFRQAVSAIRVVKNQWHPALRAAVSNDEGIVRLLVGQGERLAIEASAAGLPFLVEEIKVSDRSVRLSFETGQMRALRVIDAKQQPVAGALVFAKGRRLPLAKTNSDGVARLGLMEGESEDLIVIDAAGRHGCLLLRTVEPTQNSPEIVRLAEPMVLSGTVIALDTRQPIADAWVEGSDRYGDSQKTDAGGGYRLVAVGDEVTVLAAKMGRLPSSDLWLETSGGFQVPTLALPPAATLRGVVLDGAGNPLSSVEVTAAQERPNFRMTLRGHASRKTILHTQTNNAGQFRFSDLAVDQAYTLFLSRKGFALQTLEVESLKASEPKSVRVVMEVGLRAEGLVVDGEERGVRGAEIELTPNDLGQRGVARQFFGRRNAQKETVPILSDENGRFVVEDLAAGNYDLKVSARGYAPATVRGLEIKPLADPEAQGRFFDLGMLLLDPGAEVTGWVLDQNEQPISDAQVYWAAEGNRRFSMGLPSAEDPAAISGADGFFTLRDLLPESRIVISASHPGYITGILSGIETPSDQPVKVTLKPSSRVSGVVVDEDGQPVVGARVQFMAEGKGGSNPMGHLGPGARSFASSDSEGRFVIEGVASGPATLTAAAEGFQPTRISGQPVPEAGELADVRLVLQPGATVQGTVRAADGSPVVGARVQISETGSSGFGGILDMVSTDGDGQFRSFGISPGKRVVKATYELQQAAAEATLELGVNNIDLTLQEGVEVLGWVVDEAGKPIGGVKIGFAIKDSFWERREVTSGQDGNFVVEGVLPGTYEVTFSREGYAQGRLPSPLLVAGEPISGVELRLQKGAVLRGRILGLDFDEMAQVRVNASGPGSSYQSGTVDFEGAYRIENLMPGPWTVHASSRASGRQTQAQVEIETGVPEAEQDLRFGDGYTLTGSFLIDEEPVQGASVRARSQESGGGGVSATDSSGAFRIEGLAEGEYLILLYDFSTQMTLQRKIELRGDEEIPFHLMTGLVAGKVEDALDDSPISGVLLSLASVEADAESKDGSLSRRSASDSSGFFSFGRVPEGRWTVRVQSNGYAAKEIETTVAAGQDIDDLEISLQPTEGIVFEVALPSGFSAREVNAVVLDASGERVSGGRYTATEEGRVRISDVPSGNFELLVTSSGSAVAQRMVTSPGKSDRVQLEAGSQLELISAELQDQPVSANVTLIRSDGREHQQLTYGAVRSEFDARRGRFQLEQVASGRYEVRVETKDGRSWTASVDVVPGVLNSVEIP